MHIWPLFLNGNPQPSVAIPCFPPNSSQNTMLSFPRIMSYFMLSVQMWQSTSGKNLQHIVRKSVYLSHSASFRMSVFRRRLRLALHPIAADPKETPPSDRLLSSPLYSYFIFFQIVAINVEPRLPVMLFYQNPPPNMHKRWQTHFQFFLN